MKSMYQRIMIMLAGLGSKDRLLFLRRQLERQRLDRNSYHAQVARGCC